MTDTLTIDELVDTRAAFLKKAAIFGGGVVAAASGAMALPSSALSSTASDIAILNFALTLEYLEATFYTIAEHKAPLKGEAKKFARIVGSHERAHVTALMQTIAKLGGTPVKKPLFDFRSAWRSESAFLATAMALEDTGVSAYNGAGPALTLTPVKAAAASIVAVEAQHASWAHRLNGLSGAPLAFDIPKNKAEVLAAAGPFIRG